MRCPLCKGIGFIIVINVRMPLISICPKCNGRGEIDED